MDTLEKADLRTSLPYQFTTLKSQKPVAEKQKEKEHRQLESVLRFMNTQKSSNFCKSKKGCLKLASFFFMYNLFLIFIKTLLTE